MSGHLIGCTGAVDSIPSSHKLALLAFADSADDRTHIAFPGYEGVQRWANVSRSRAAELIRDLVSWGYLTQHKAARRGQRAEYVVFPAGCCDLHRTPAEEPPVDVVELARAAGVTIDQARALLTAMGPVVQDTAPRAQDPANGSDASDTSPLNGSEPSDPNGPVVHETAPKPVDNPTRDADRVQMGSGASDPFTPSTTSPLTPASGGAGCARHTTTARNCRGCGTTNRQLAAKAKAEKEAARRAAAVAAAAAERARPKGLAGDAAAHAKAAARAGAARAKHQNTMTGATR